MKFLRNWSTSAKVTVGILVVLIAWAVVRSVIYNRMAATISHHGATESAVEAARKLVLKDRLHRVFKDRADFNKIQAIRTTQVLAGDMERVVIEDHHLSMAEASASALIDFLGDLELPVRFAAADALGRMGKPAARPLVAEALTSADKDVRSNATAALTTIGTVAVPELIEAVKSGTPTQRVGAATALGDLGAVRAVPALISALSAVEQDVRLTARDSLVTLGEPGVDLLIEAMANANAFTRLHSAEALGEIGDDRAAEVLLEHINDDHRQVRLAATYAVGKVGDPGAIAELITKLDDDDREMREAAAVSLGQLDAHQALPQLVLALEDPIEAVREQAAAALGRIDPDDRDILTDIVARSRATDQGTRSAAVLALGLIGDPRTAEAVAARLDPRAEPSIRVRRRAAAALASISSSASIDALIDAFGDQDWRVNYAAQEALAAIGEPAVQPLINLLDSADPLQALYARKALSAMDPPPVDALIEAGRSSGAQVRLAAVLALSKLSAENAALDALQAMTDDRDRRVREAAQRAVDELLGPDTETAGDPGSEDESSTGGGEASAATAGAAPGTAGGAGGGAAAGSGGAAR